MTAIKLGDESLAIGLSWLPPEDWSTRKQENRQIRRLSAAKPTPVAYVSISTKLGVQIGTTPNLDDVGLKSAAAWLAQIQHSAVLIEKIGNDKYWLCAIEDGAIFPAGDMIGNKELVQSRLNEIHSDIEGTDIKIFEREGVFDIEEYSQIGFVDLVRDTDLNADVRCQKLVKRNFKKPVLSVFAGLTLVACTFGLWSYAFSPNRIGKTDKVDQQQIVQQLLEQEKNALLAKLNQNSGVLLANFADIVYGRPQRAAGWRIQFYEWQNETISIGWYRSHGNIQSLTDYLGQRNFNLNENSGVVIEKFPFPNVHKTGDISVDNLIGDSFQRMKLLDTLSVLPGKWFLNASKKYGNAYPVFVSKISGTSKHLNEVIATAHLLKDFPLHIKRLKVTLGETYSWEVDGEFYAHYN